MKHKDGTALSEQEIIAIYKKRYDRKLRDAWQPSQEKQEEIDNSGMISNHP